MIGRQKQQPQGRPRPLRRGRDPLHGVFSYYSAKATLDTDQRLSTRQPQGSTVHLGQGRLQRWSQRVRLIMPLVGVVLLIAYVLCLDTKTHVVVVGNNQTQQLYQGKREAYERTAQEAIGVSLANRTKITFDAVRVEDELIKRFPELETARVRLPLFGMTPTVEVTPAAPALVLTTQQNGSVLIDQKGYARAVADARNAKGLPMVTDLNDVPVELGELVLPVEHVGFILELIHQSSAKSRSFSAIQLPAKPYELHAQLKGKSFYGIFNLEDVESQQQQIGTFLATVEHLEKENVRPSQYVDVRVEGRTYYK